MELNVLVITVEPCNVMFNVISDIIEHWQDMQNTIVIAFNFRNRKEMICELMFILSNH